MPVSQVISRRFTIRLLEVHAEHMYERRKDKEVRRPTMDRANQPAELHLRHDELNALERELLAPLVVEEKQNAGDHLNDEEEQ